MRKQTIQKGTDERILVLAPTGSDADLTCGLLEEAGISALACRSMTDLSAELDMGCGAVVIAEEALNRESSQTLIEHLSRQPSWSAIPLCIITSSGERSTATLLNLTAKHAPGNVTILERPFRKATFLNTVEFAVGARRRQYQVRDLLQERESILGSIEDAFMTLDRDWRFVYANARAAALVQSSVRRMIGRKFSDVCPDLIGSPIEEGLRRAIDEKTLVTLEYFHTPVGRWVHQRIYASARGVSVFTTDITDRKRTEAALAKAQEELNKYADSLETLVHQRTASLQETNAQLEAFCYTIAHDLRAPLRAQQGFANILLENYADRLDESGRNYAHRILKAAGRLDKLVDDLLAFARVARTEIQLDPVNLRKVVDQVREDMESELRSSHFQMETLDVMVLAHEPMLKTAITNLVSNALKFRRPDVPTVISICAENVPSGVRLWIRDNGIGIAPEYHDQIFGVFNRLHKVDTYPGTGVGLAIVQKAIERMGGKVGVQSTEGIGSSFWIDLKKAPLREHTE